MIPCINLREQFGRRYKVQYEESYYAEHGPNAWVEDPWLMIIPCRNGHICPWGETTLAACTDKAGPIAKRLKALPFTTTHQDGDDGANVLFEVEHFDEVAEIMIPRRRRQVSEEERRRLAEAGAKYRFRRGYGASHRALESTIGGQSV